MKAASDSLRALLDRHPLFGKLEPEARARVAAESAEIHLGDGEILYQSGEVADRVFVLLSGALQIEYPFGNSVRGKVTIVLLAPGFLGECQVLNQIPWSGTGVAVTDLLSLGIKKQRFVELTAQHPALTQALYFELSVRFLHAIESWRQQPALKPDVAMARYLLARSDVLRALGRADHVIAIRQVDLARAVELRAETVNRVLSRWAKAGWVEKTAEGLMLSAREQLEALVSVPPLCRRCELPEPALSIAGSAS